MERVLSQSCKTITIIWMEPRLDLKGRASFFVGAFNALERCWILHNLAMTLHGHWGVLWTTWLKKKGNPVAKRVHLKERHKDDTGDIFRSALPWCSCVHHNPSRGWLWQLCKGCVIQVSGGSGRPICLKLMLHFGGKIPSVDEDHIHLSAWDEWEHETAVCVYTRPEAAEWRLPHSKRGLLLWRRFKPHSALNNERWWWISICRAHCAERHLLTGILSISQLQQCSFGNSLWAQVKDPIPSLSLVSFHVLHVSVLVLRLPPSVRRPAHASN